MFCSKCGKELKEGVKFCGECGASVEKNEKNNTNQGATQRNVPKCTHCGYEGQWKVGPVFRTIDWILGIAFMFLGFIPGLVYFIVVAAIRSNEDNREKICPKCNAKNLWTFFY